MSGAAGGSRIDRENLKQTIRNYRDNVLKPLGLDGSYNVTGVRSRRDKYSYGDIDIVVAFKGGNRAELKQKLAGFLSQVGDIPTMPHKKDKKYFIHGNIVTTLYPIANREGEYVQIDNIVAVSEEEGKFTYSMLDLPAEQQTLAISLVKAIFTELDPTQTQNLFQQLGIKDPEQPGEGEEYDFNLNSTELSLRILPVGKNDGREIWKSTKYSDVKTVLIALGIDIEKDSFSQIVEKVKQFKHRRSVERFKGLYNRNIRVGPAEKDTEKGNNKQQALDIVAALQESDKQKVIAVFPGKFKPPHKDHIARIKAAAQDADEVIVLISPKTEPGGNAKTKKDQQRLQDRLQQEQPVTADQSLEIFKLASLPTNVTVMRSDDSKLPVPAASPVTAAYEIFKANPQQQYIAVFGKEEDFSRYGTVPPNVTIKNYDSAAGNLSATDVRKALKAGQDLAAYLPDGVDQQKYKEIILGKTDPKSIEEVMLETIDEVLANLFPKKQAKVVREASSGTAVSALATVRSVDRATLSHLYDHLRETIPLDQFDVIFQQDRIYIYNKQEDQVGFDYTPYQKRLGESAEGKFDYTPHIASILEYMMDQGVKITPLPDIVTKEDPQQASNFFGKTAYYSPTEMKVVLYTLGRHPKDVCRSFAHEMIHHKQNLQGRLGNIQTTNINEDEYLKEIEREAYLEGNEYFRGWEDKVKNG